MIRESVTKMNGGSTLKASRTFDGEGSGRNDILSQRPQTLFERLFKFYLIPDGPYLYVWDRIMILVAIASHVLITFMVAFTWHSLWGFAVCFVLDLFFLVDIYNKCHTAYLQNGFWVIFPKQMLMRYVSSWDFKFDVIANIPIELFALIALGVPNSRWDLPTVLTYVRLPKLIRTIRIWVYFRRQERKLHASFNLQLVKFISYMVVLKHTIACLWFVVACPDGLTSCHPNSWVMVNTNVNEDSIAGFYVASIYWTVTTMTTTGYGDIHAENSGERVFAFCTMIIGYVFYGYVSGTIASTLSNMDSRRVAYQQKLDAVRQYMADRDMDTGVQQRVIDYYDYLWERNRGIDVANVFSDLPATFRSEVALSVNHVIIDKAAIFRSCSEGFRRKIAVAMRMYLFIANEYLVHKGDIGPEMYFVGQGRIDLYESQDLRRPTASLIEGGHFVCNSDIYILTKEDLQEAFESFPEDRNAVVAATTEQYSRLQVAKQSRKGLAMNELEEEFGATGDPYVPGLVADKPLGVWGSKPASRVGSHTAINHRRGSKVESHHGSANNLRTSQGTTISALKKSSSAVAPPQAPGQDDGKKDKEDICIVVNDASAINLATNPNPTSDHPIDPKATEPEGIPSATPSLNRKNRRQSSPGRSFLDD
ncbi:hypothetical protein HK102_003286 [Quaeritorhiza haematococci]|nr:hypothetical protein HK102_003286 [Quaeritorhiza haematococci]